MHLKSISIQNFKAYKDAQEIPLKPITLIFGPNSAGKSTIVHALAFLKNAYLKNGNCSPDEVDLVWDKVTLGGWQNLLHGHDSSQTMKIGLGLRETKVNWSFLTVAAIPSVKDCVIQENGRPILSAINHEPGQIDWTISLYDLHPVMLDHDPFTDDPDDVPHGIKGNVWRFLTGSGKKKMPQYLLLDGDMFGWDQFNIRFLEYLKTAPCKPSGLFPKMQTEEKKSASLTIFAVILRMNYILIGMQAKHLKVIFSIIWKGNLIFISISRRSLTPSVDPRSGGRSFSNKL